MPEIVSEPQRWVIPAILLVSIVGTALDVWREKRRPTSYKRRWEAEMAEWRSKSTSAQAAHDDAALAAAEAAETAAARSHALYRP
ncbi:hypothetical protein D3C59_34320 [Streptomyces sp. SHP22-7]|nr:hypothetical protein D3C59_36120 [Streptomyces sp. SHP22-7]RIH58569.1 hypothetical protein D3C59_34320 [Streptomyces sp. SHP22-7]